MKPMQIQLAICITLDAHLVSIWLGFSRCGRGMTGFTVSASSEPGDLVGGAGWSTPLSFGLKAPLLIYRWSDYFWSPLLVGFQRT